MVGCSVDFKVRRRETVSNHSLATPSYESPSYERQGCACEPTPLLHCDMHTPACRPAALCDIKNRTLNKRQVDGPGNTREK